MKSITLFRTLLVIRIFNRHFFRISKRIVLFDRSTFELLAFIGLSLIIFGFFLIVLKLILKNFLAIY